MKANSLPGQGRARGMSVGTKLAIATAVLIAAVAVSVYFALSRSLAQTLLTSKGDAAQEVALLFAANVSAAVVFEDREVLAEGLKHLAKNEDVTFAAVWAGPRGESGKELGRYARAGNQQRSRVTTASEPRLAWAPDVLSVSVPVRDDAGTIIARALIEFSLANENAKIAATKQRVLYISAAVGIAVVLLLLVVSRRTVLLPLQRLQAGARQTERGEVACFDIRSGDEVGELASALTQMAKAIREREAEVRRRNRDMRLVMDNVGQGFLTLNEQGNMSDEYSHVLEEWFGKPVAGESFATYLERIEPKFAFWFAAAFDQLGQQLLPLELALGQFPKRLAHAGNTWSFEYRPISSQADRFEGLVIVINDITQQLEESALQQDQQETIAALTRTARDPHGFLEFLREAEALVSAIEQAASTDRDRLFRDIHTLKGIASIMDVHSLVEYCHDLEEQRLDEPEIAPERRQRLRQIWSRYLERIEPLVPSSQNQHVVLDRARYSAFLLSLESGRARADLLEEARSWELEDAERVLDRLAQHARQLAGRLAKGDVLVQIESSGVRIPHHACSSLWTALVHAVRNAVDHGLETPLEREALGKPARGTLRLTTRWSRDDLVVEVSDDGRGVDWGAIARRAADMNLPNATRADLERALFSERLTTRASASETSGRGVGTAVLKEAVTELGGRIEVESELGRGTTFRFSIPRDRVVETEHEIPSARPRTLGSRLASASTTT